MRLGTIGPLGNNFHDAIWILALALNATDGWLKANKKTLCEYRYGNPTIANRIQNEVSKIRFVGASGVNSYVNGTRFTPGLVLMTQLVSGEALSIAVYPVDDQLRYISKECATSVDSYQKVQNIFGNVSYFSAFCSSGIC